MQKESTLLPFQEDRPDEQGPEEEWGLPMARAPLDHTPSSARPILSLPAPPRRDISMRRVRWLLALIVGMVILVSLTIFSASPALTTTTMAPVATTIGQLRFSSSGQLDPTSRTGLNDTVTLTLDHPSPLSPGMREDAWLIPDAAHASVAPLWLGTLAIIHGAAHLTYIQPDHQNLLALFAGVRVTEDRDGTGMPTDASNPATWRDAGSIPTTPTPGDEQHYSLLDHLRHLLASDPTLEALGLSGGLGIWLDRNTGKLFEWSNAARDSWAGGQSTALIHRQLLRILAYLDGSPDVWRDVPVGSPLLVDPLAGRIGLLELDPTQNPPGYLSHIDVHLQGVISAPGHTAEQVRLAEGMQQALTQVKTLLQQIRQDALSLVTLNDTQLQQPQALSLLDDMTTAASAAYMGQDGTGGVAWVEQQLEGLAVIPLVGMVPANQK